MKARFILIIVALIATNVLSVWWFSRPSLNEVMGDFYIADGRAEDMLMDPLILNRDIVRAHVSNEILDARMNKRRYAIGFLGNERITESLPNLDKIVRTPAEKDYFRSDALEATWQIKKEKGIALAQEFQNEPGILGETAKEILSGNFSPHVRTYQEALTGHHDSESFHE